MRVPRCATFRTKLIVQELRLAASTPSPPAISNVESADAGPNLRASISAPDEERTGPGSAAITRSAGTTRA